MILLFLLTSTTGLGICNGFDFVWVRLSKWTIPLRDPSDPLCTTTKPQNANRFLHRLIFYRGRKPKVLLIAIGFVASLFWRLGSWADRWSKHKHSLFYNAGLCFLISIWTINHFLNSFQLIKTVPDCDCWTSEFPFNCLAFVLLVGCGHLFQAGGIALAGEHWGRLMTALCNNVCIILQMDVLKDSIWFAYYFSLFFSPHCL